MVELPKNFSKVTPQNEPKQPDHSAKTAAATVSSCDVSFDKARFENILDNIPSGIVVIEKPNGKITYANKRAIELHGQNPCGIEITKPILHSENLLIGRQFMPNN